MNERNLTQLIEKWRLHVIPKGSEFLLPPNMAVEFATDIARQNELIMGWYGWRYVDKEKGWIVQDLAVELSVEELVPWVDMTPKRNLQTVVEFLKNLTSSTDLVSFQLNDPAIEEKIIEVAF